MKKRREPTGSQLHELVADRFPPHRSVKSDVFACTPRIAWIA